MMELVERYSCPNITSFSLLNSFGGNNFVGQGNVHQFLYVVNSCHSMNDIKQTLGVEPVTCAEYDDVLSALDKIEVNVKNINKYFDPVYYTNNDAL